MFAVEPDKGDGGSIALWQAEQVFASAISLAHLTLDSIAIYGVLELTLRYADEQAVDVLLGGETIDYAQWEGRETLATLTWFKQPVDEMMAAQPFTFGECIGVKAHWLISLLTLEGNGAGHPS